MQKHYSFRCSSVVVAVFLTLGLVAQTDTTKTSVLDSLDNAATANSSFIISESDLDAELGGQDISGLLRASRDVFSSTAGFNFGIARFRIRGLDSYHTNVSINGITMNDLETGRAAWWQWGGLNDITRYQTSRTGIHSSRVNFGGIGGYALIDARATATRKGTRVSYARTNRAYRNRLMVTHATGMQANGWAFTISASRRWAEEGYVEGTYYDAYAYYLSAERKLNDKHSFGLVAFGAPNVRGLQGLATQEAYDLTDNNYYNPYWGLQDGEKRNSREGRAHRPTVMFSHYYKPNSKTTWNTTAAYTFGGRSRTSLNWYDAKDPRPDYYRYLPSYYAATDVDNFNQLTNAWQNDVYTQQIDWNHLYFANGKNLYSLENANGIEGNTLVGNRSKYVVEEWKNDISRLALNSVMNKKLKDGHTLTAGVNVIIQKNRLYKEMDDLLGGDFWVDVDQFAEQDFIDPNAAQNDLANPNNVIREGDVFGYDYDMNNNRRELFGQYEFENNKWQAYATGMLGIAQIWRDGSMQNGRFPDNSAGKSDLQNYTMLGMKLGATYKINGRNFVIANVAAQQRPPSNRNVFISPRTRNDAVPGLTEEKILSGDLTYEVRYTKLKGRATVFYAEVNDQLWNRSYYHDEFRNFVNYTMQGIDQRHMGVELGLQGQLTQTISATAVVGTGEYIYNSRPTAKITADNTQEVLAEDRLIYLKNYKIGGMPQTAASLGLRYNDPKYWFIGVNANFFKDIFLDPNPDRRTSEALANIVIEDAQWNTILDQTELAENMTIGLFAGKSWRLKNRTYLRVNVSINNLLDEQELAVGGYEQLRYDRTDIDKFPPKLGYLYGRNFFAMASYTF